MRVFGFEIKRAPQSQPPNNVVQSVWGSFVNWLGPIRESFTGAWQQNVTIDGPANLLQNSAVFACTTGIASDVAKLRIKLTEDDGNDIWEEITSGSPFLQVLRKPNGYQNRIQFIEQWVISKLLAGNTYILKERADQRGMVTALYPLNPRRVTPLITETGDIYYQLKPDYLSGLPDIVTVPASEVIHDMMCALWHPLIGVPPLYACAASASLGNKISSNSMNLFGNASRPGGILTAPGHIQDDTAQRLKKAFEENFSGANVGRLAVLGDGLKFEPMVLTAENSQLVEQLKWTVDDVARAYHYPIWKLGGPMPPYSSGPQAMTTAYYTDCLQILIECIELCLNEGIELPNNYSTEMDIDNLLRMDTVALNLANKEGVLGGWLAPNEARYRANLAPVDGGESPYLQQQNYSLAALAKRDAQEDPFASKQPTTAPATPAPIAPPAIPAKRLINLDLLGSEFRKQLVASS